MSKILIAAQDHGYQNSTAPADYWGRQLRPLTNFNSHNEERNDID